MITITGLDDFPTALSILPLADGRRALACVHFPTPGTNEIAYSKAYLVDAGWHATAVGQSEPYGKDIGCALLIEGTTLYLIVTEPPPGGGGAASKVDVYAFPIGVGVAGAGSVDLTARAQIATLRAALHQV